jgi:protein-tyrosine phosphatase
VFNWLKKRTATSLPGLSVDIHSHLLPGLDDGVKTFDEALEVILFLKDCGYTRLITTPHVISDAFRNTTAGINEKLGELRSFLVEKKVTMQIEAAAEYYLDDTLIEKIESNERLLTIGANHLLFETNFISEPFILKDFIFKASTKGYKLILAHPERYLYLYNNLAKLEDLLHRGVLFQINISSLTGYYSKPAQVMAQKLIDKGWVHLLGTDCHHLAHARLIKEAQRNKYYQKALTLPLLNQTLK